MKKQKLPRYFTNGNADPRCAMCGTPLLIDALRPKEKENPMKTFILGIIVGALPFLFILWYFWNDMFGMRYPV